MFVEKRMGKNKKKGSKAKAKAKAKKEGGDGEVTNSKQQHRQGERDTVDSLCEGVKRLRSVWTDVNAELLAELESFATAAASARGVMTAAASPSPVGEDSGATHGSKLAKVAWEEIIGEGSGIGGGLGQAYARMEMSLLSLRGSIVPKLESTFSEMTSAMDRCGQAIADMQDRGWIDVVSQSSGANDRAIGDKEDDVTGDRTIGDKEDDATDLAIGDEVTGVDNVNDIEIEKHEIFVGIVELMCAYERELNVKRRIVADLQTDPPTDSEVLTNYCTVVRVQPHIPLAI